MSRTSVQEMKKTLRERVWKDLEDKDLARFPRPVFNRIPNFVGAEKAAAFIVKLEEFSRARVVKVNPDSPQAHVRRLVLEAGKTLLMATPRLMAGFLRLDPSRISEKMIKKATSIRGAFALGEKIQLSNLPPVDLIVAGSVAVSLQGGRIGKGEGYSELEYGILRECGLVDDEVRTLTTVHDRQIVDDFPSDRYDLPVDYVLTPTKTYETHTALPRPRGIYWDLITGDMLREMPLLEELRERSQPK